MAFCTKCGAALTEGARFCTTCGAVAETQPQAAPVQPVQNPAPTYNYAPAPVAPRAPAKNNTVLWIVVAVVVVIALVLALDLVSNGKLDFFQGNTVTGQPNEPVGTISPEGPSEPVEMEPMPTAGPMPMPSDPAWD